MITVVPGKIPDTNRDVAVLLTPSERDALPIQIDNHVLRSRAIDRLVESRLTAPEYRAVIKWLGLNA